MRNLLLIFSLLLLHVYAQEFAIATANWNPYAFKTKNGTYKGIAADITKEIITRSGNTYTIGLYPTNRLKRLFEYGKIDINFADSPLWNDKKGDYVFTEPYLYVKEFIYLLKSSPLRLTEIKDLKEKTVGVEIGYHYEALEKAFENGTVRKDEAPNSTSLIQKLIARRNDAIIMDELLFRHLVKKLALGNNLFKRSLMITQAPLCMKLNSKYKPVLPMLNKTIDALQNDKTIDRVLQQYSY